MNDRLESLQSEVSRLRAELAAVRQSERDVWKHMILDGDALHNVRAECKKMCTDCEDFSADDAAQLVMGLMDARLASAEAVALAMRNEAYDEAYIKDAPLGVLETIRALDPAAVARAALAERDEAQSKAKP